MIERACNLSFANIASRKHVYEINTSLYPVLYHIVKLDFPGYTSFSYYCFKTDCGQSMFLAKILKLSNFRIKVFIFYSSRKVCLLHVFVMTVSCPYNIQRFFSSVKIVNFHKKNFEVFNIFA